MKPVVSAIAVYDRATGAMSYLAPADHRPTDASLTWVALPAGFDATWKWEAAKRSMIEDATRVEAQLIAEVKAEAERRKMLAMSPGGAKKAEYAEKRAEVAAWDSLATAPAAILAAFNALPKEVRESRFGHVLADAAAFGDTPVAAIARFRAGMGKAAALRTVSALEAKTCADVRAASSIAGKRAAAAPLMGAA